MSVEIAVVRNPNCVRPLPTSWENIVGLFTSGHEVVENKEDIYLFNAVRYKTIDLIPDGSEGNHAADNSRSHPAIVLR